MRPIMAGFHLGFICFPPWEWLNWKWGRETREQMFAVGPMRIKCERVNIWR